MKTVALLHNPGAGKEAHDREKLTALVEAGGFDCIYVSVKEPGWKEIDPAAGFLAIAGGDGTVRKAVKALTGPAYTGKAYQIGLLPLGTANNISRTLNITDELPDIIASWHDAHPGKMDAGLVTGTQTSDFFLEGAGFGVFPALMQAAKRQDTDKADSPEEEKTMALQLLTDIIRNYPCTPCTLQADGKDHSGNYLLAEVMNIRSIGPNLALNPGADPGDGIFEIVLIGEDQREDLLAWVGDLIRGQEPEAPFSVIRAREIRMAWSGIYGHVDDKLLETAPLEALVITVQPGRVTYLLPGMRAGDTIGVP